MNSERKTGYLDACTSKRTRYLGILGVGKGGLPPLSLMPVPPKKRIYWHPWGKTPVYTLDDGYLFSYIFDRFSEPTGLHQGPLPGFDYVRVRL